MEEDKPVEPESICISDFCGTGHYIAGGGVRQKSIYPCQFWADWWPKEKAVTFGGFWFLVPNMPAETEPTEEAVEAWAEKHGGWVEGYERWLKESQEEEDMNGPVQS